MRLLVLCCLALAAATFPLVTSGQEGPDAPPETAEDIGLSVAEPDYDRDEPVTIELVGYEPGDIEMVGTARLIGPVTSDVDAGDALDPCDFEVEIDEKSTAELAETGKITRPVVVPALCPNVKLTVGAHGKEPVTGADGKLSTRDVTADVSYHLLLNGDLTARESGKNVYMSERLQTYPMGNDAPASALSNGTDNGRYSRAAAVLSGVAFALLLALGGGWFFVRQRRT